MHDSIVLNVFIAESGSLYIFNGGKSFPLGDATGNCGSIYVEPCPSIKVCAIFMSKKALSSN